MVISRQGNLPFLLVPAQAPAPSIALNVAPTPTPPTGAWTKRHRSSPGPYPCDPIPQFRAPAVLFPPFSRSFQLSRFRVLSAQLSFCSPNQQQAPTFRPFSPSSSLTRSSQLSQLLPTCKTLLVDGTELSAPPRPPVRVKLTSYCPGWYQGQISAPLQRAKPSRTAQLAARPMVTVASLSRPLRPELRWRRRNHAPHVSSRARTAQLRPGPLTTPCTLAQVGSG